jgi:(1->4)-alpha-D-glucan 1-alpha-D-glucosylmutase
MLATSTHDNKRSEDVRVRIDALSELPREWSEAAREWAGINEGKRVPSEDGPMPARNDEYLLYQTLVGAWPLVELDEPGREAFIERIQRYMQKATHEAKVHTSWISPDEEYDAAVSDFVAGVLRDPEFLGRLLPFQRRVAHLGMLSALSQTLLKLTLPGVPDVYQGQELWDLSLVDPDNRRPVDYERRARLLEEIAGRGAGERSGLARSLMERWEDGGPKLLVTHAALSARRRRRALFREGEYRPLQCIGARARHVVAFARLHGEAHAVVGAPRLFAPLTRGGARAAPEPEAWGDTAVLLPPETPVRRLRDELFGGTYEAERAEDGASLPLRSLLAEFPVALLAPVGVA